MGEFHCIRWQMQCFDFRMKVIHELGVIWCTLNNQKNFAWVSFSKQYFSISGINQWTNQSWKMSCVTQALKLYFYTTRREHMAMF